MLTSLLLLIVFISVLVFYRPLACKRPTQLFILDIINIVYIYVCYLALSRMCLALQVVFSRIIMCRYFSDKHYVACSCPEILWQLIFCTVFNNITYYINNWHSSDVLCRELHSQCIKQTRYTIILEVVYVSCEFIVFLYFILKLIRLCFCDKEHESSHCKFRVAGKKTMFINDVTCLQDYLK